MNYKILPTKEFEKDLKKIDSNLQLRIKKKIEEIAQNPTRYKHLHFEFKGSCRIRIGKLRILFSYNTEACELYPEQIIFGHKY
jgi:mRNA-degrading endonuclease RelE of RelBE toxin-antitoxin system|tara:strand:- start:212 stop:460 length:249 start_codon:yes stop_codon:yes gene_type:complete